MTTKTSTPELIAEELAALEAESAKRRAKLAAINDAENSARRATELDHYRVAANDRATDYRTARDNAGAHRDAIAAADTIDLNELFNAFLEFKRLDAMAGALHSHAARIDYVDPLPPNEIGAPRSHVVACSSLYDRLKWSEYLDWVVAERTKQARSGHARELESEVSTKITAAVEQARAAAAADN